jgi:tetratricopeptide (TPR) repeat protein
MMGEEDQLSPSLSITGSYNAQVYGGGSATVNVYQGIVPRPVEQSAVATAIQKLATLPLDSLPGPAVSALSPASRLPSFARNNKFVGREAELARIASILKPCDLATVAITGLGGIGKSQLASEFVYRYGQYFAGGIFWLSFATVDAVFAEVAACTTALEQELRLDVKTLPVKEQVDLVLSSWQNPLPRLLVFDNCENEQLLAHWHPPIGGCRILLTSRRAVWHPDLDVSVVPLDVFPREQSVKLLGNYRSDLSVTDRDLIAQELGDLPLALSVAGSYLRTYQDSSLGLPKHYLLALRQMNPLEHPSLQQEGSTYTTGHTEHVARTFALSYEQLHSSEVIDAMALHMLAHAAYFAPGEPIPRDLLYMTMGLEENDESESFFVKALQRVHTLGLLITQQEGMLQMHRLLVMFVQMRLISTKAAMEAQAAVEEAVLHRAREVSNPDYRTYRELLELQEHLRTVTTRASKRGDTMAADLNAAFGKCLYRIGAYEEAQRHLESALLIREQNLGPGYTDVAFSLDVADSFDNLADAYKREGRYEEAELPYQRALHLREQSREPGHPNVVYTFYMLARLYSMQGKYEEAESCYQLVLQSLEPGHPDVAFLLTHLADLYSMQGKYEEAELPYQRGLHLNEQNKGPGHTDVGCSFDSLADLYSKQGKYEEAESCYQRALHIWEQLLPDIGRLQDLARSLGGLAALYSKQGKYEEAESCYQRALHIWEQLLGPMSYYVARSLDGLAALYQEQGKYEEAKSSYQRALHIWESMWHDDHHTQVIRANYASLLQEIERNTKRKGWKWVLEFFSRREPPHH